MTVRRVVRLLSACTAVLLLVTLGAGLGSGAVPRAAVGHAGAAASVFLKPGVSTADIKRLPVAPGQAVPVVVSGVMMQFRASDGKKYCWDAFYYDLCGLTQANGVVNTIWVGPPGWTGDISHTSPLSSLSVPAGSPYPAFNPNHVYHLTLNLTGKQLLWAYPHGPAAAAKDTWSGGLRLDFNGTPAPAGGNPCGKVARAASPPPSQCPLTVLPPPTGFGQPTTGAAPPPGDAAVTESPNLGALEGVILANVTYVSPADQVIEVARHQCFVNFTHAIFEYVSLATPEERTAIKQEFPKVLAVLLSQGLSQRTGFHWVDQLAACVAYVDAVEASRPGTQHGVVQRAAAASASCAMSPIALSLSGSGAATRLKSFKVGGSSALRTSCTSSRGRLTISVAATSNAIPLRDVVGSHLGLAIMRSKKDRPGGQLSIVFDHASSAASWTGAWNTDFGAMSLTESGTHVTGTYAYCNGSATIAGQLTGSTLDGTWTQPCNAKSGRLHFVLSPDGSSFTGTWGYGNAVPTSPWNGTHA